MVDTFAENPSFFDSMRSSAATDLLTLQLTAGQPESATGTAIVSDPIVPDRATRDRLGHFDPTLYDLRETSHLIKLLNVLLGGAGAGGLRKQMAVARMQNAFHGMHFLDLDRFYGALFGIRRTGPETQLQPDFNPYTDAATSDEWDDLHSRDASYRDRLVKFAKAIPFGGSYLGLRSMAEALIADEAEIYESWQWVDELEVGAGEEPVLTYTYGYLEDNIETWGALEDRTWGDWGGGVNVFTGRTGQLNRSEWVIHPKRLLDADEHYQLLRVINVFKPAGTQVTVNNAGLTIHSPLDIRAVAASSEHWEITSSAIPNANMNYNPYLQQKYVRYPKTKTGIFQPIETEKVTGARPAFSQYTGEEWSYNGDILSATSYTLDDPEQQNDELVVYSDGTLHSYQASHGLLSPAAAESARMVSDGVLASMPYAPGRSGINLATVTP